MFKVCLRAYCWKYLRSPRVTAEMNTASRNVVRIQESGPSHAAEYVKALTGCFEGSQCTRYHAEEEPMTCRVCPKTKGAALPVSLWGCASSCTEMHQELSFPTNRPSMNVVHNLESTLVL